MALRLRNYHLARVGLVAIRANKTSDVNANSKNLVSSAKSGSKRHSSSDANGNHHTLYRRVLNLLRSPRRNMNTNANSVTQFVVLDDKSFDAIAEETLQSLTDVFEEDISIAVEDIDVRLSVR